MKKCPYCFSEADDRATVCPSCKKGIGGAGTDGVARKPLPPCGLAILGVAIIIAIFTIMGALDGNRKGGVPSDTKPMAFYMSQYFVKEKLKSPSSAKFPYYEPSFVKEQAEDSSQIVYQVVSYVDAQNSFGAMIRSNFMCGMVYKKKAPVNQQWRSMGCIIE